MEFTLTVRSPPMLKIGDFGFPMRVHLMLRTLVDSIIICCTVCTNMDTKLAETHVMQTFSKYQRTNHSRIFKCISCPQLSLILVSTSEASNRILQLFFSSYQNGLGLKVEVYSEIIGTRLKLENEGGLSDTLYLTETAKMPKARLPCRSSRMSRTSCLAVDSTKGLLMHSNSLQSSPKSIPSTIRSASDLSAVVTSVPADSFATGTLLTYTFLRV